MNNLENYLDKLDGQNIDKTIYDDYERFGYEDEMLFHHHLNFMLDNLYYINIVEPMKIRLNQEQFRANILERFNNKCVITDENCIDELDAAHIVEVRYREDYDVDNGLLLTKNLHSTFDKNYWSISPNTLKIEINQNIQNIGSIKDYQWKTLNLKLNQYLLNNLMERYQKFLNFTKKN